MGIFFLEFGGEISILGTGGSPSLKVLHSQGWRISILEGSPSSGELSKHELNLFKSSTECCRVRLLFSGAFPGDTVSLVGSVLDPGWLRGPWKSQNNDGAGGDAVGVKAKITIHR